MGLGKTIRNTILTTGISAVLMPAMWKTTIALLHDQQHSGTTITNRQELEQVLEKEKIKLGLDHQTRIELGTKDPYETLVSAWAEKIGERQYRITFVDWPTRATVRHELYHVFDGHCEQKHSPAIVEYWQQSKAIIYATTGISFGRKI